ncbi:Hypothetical predicted protein [Cloeon dipterum]|uniref:Complex I assembly factor TIMMDC1, mitochondrial n=1 Tax=Cloeon dipterum TaxID=197152 RepID=A0A8S1DCP0_9INSE|nr:Hypothetical predicted protein [Cloeon dipterum]
MSWSERFLAPRDDVDVPEESKTLKKQLETYVKERGTLTPKERLYTMYSVDEFGNYSPELTSIIDLSLASFCGGAVVGGFIHSRAAHIFWMENNKATAFVDHVAAKRSLQDSIVKGMYKGGLMWGWRTAAFCGMYQAVATTAAVYRGKFGIIEHTLGGCAAGALYKANLGLRGITVGCILGGVLGTMAGACSSAICYLTGTDLDHIRYYQHQWKLREEEKKREKIKLDSGATDRVKGELAKNFAP